ncbi:MAG TPA: triple tyrosine motif-containing protein, partial [Parafilimonas sp.]
NFWVMTIKGIRKLDKNDLLKNKLQFKNLPLLYKKFASDITQIIFFDRDENCWLSGKENLLERCDKKGNVTVFPSQNLFYEKQSNTIFQDKEGILWFCFAQNGVNKLSVTNLSLLNNVYGLHYITDISYNSGAVFFYDAEAKKIVVLKDAQPQVFSIEGNKTFATICATSKALFGITSTEIYELTIKGNKLVPVKIKTDKNFEQGYGRGWEDNNGNLIVAGNKYLTAVIDGSKTMNAPVDYFADEITTDKSGDIWLATRNYQLIEFSVHPEDAGKYLQPENRYNNALSHIDARSECFDSSGNLWIGSRYKGLYKLSFLNNKISLLHFTKKQGLSDNFNSYLVCDAENNIWSCSPSGLDKISFSNNKIAVTNITQQGNLFEHISKLVFDNDSTAWVLNQTGNIIKIAYQKQSAASYNPQFYLTYIKSGKDTFLNASAYKFSYQNNNLSFYFAAPSFFNERQIQYSYRLQSENTTAWSETSSNAFVNFINLVPGNYVLQAKVFFPAAKYADETITIPFQITPPWWQTKWFTLALMIIAVAILLISIQLYVRRKLERQRIAL